MEQQQLTFPGFPEEPYENYWQYPKIMNGYWYQLTGTEQKVLDYILRHTWGYKKTSDRISLSQFKNGIKSKKTGEAVDMGIGIKKDGAILRATEKLERLGFIDAIKREGRTTEYRLRLLTKRERASNQRSEVASNQRSDTITDITINNRQYKETALAVSEEKPEIQSLIDLFQYVNPSFKKLFANKTQRASLDRLVDQHGREKIEWVIKILPRTNGMKFAPVVCTPLQLEEKLGNLIVFIKKVKLNKPIVAKIK